MKFKFIFLVLFTLTVQAFSQSKNTLSIVYAAPSNGINIHGVVGDFGYPDNRGKQFGVNYIRDINNIFSLESGITFSTDNIQLNSIVSTPSLRTVIQNSNIRLVSLPLMLRISFLKFFFVDGGLLGDFETNFSNNGSDEANKIATDQSGIGTELGFGAKYTYKHLSFFVNPFLQYHALIKFNSSQTNYNLFDNGFKFGMGYNF